MELIKPKQISGEIMTLIEEADEKMIFVSPYYNITNWEKLLNPLNKLKSRKINVEFYVREGEDKSINEVERVGFKTFPIKNLHTKLYMNEKEAIVSSMNLNSSSDTHSLDIALKTETPEEYQKIVQYYERYIKKDVQDCKQPTAARKKFYNWKEELDYMLEQSLKKDVYVRSLQNVIEIQTGNKYTVHISNDFSNELNAVGILSHKEFVYAKESRFFQSDGMAVFLQKGGYGSYDLACCRKSGLQSRSITSLHDTDQETVIDCLYRFIVQVEELKKIVR